MIGMELITLRKTILNQSFPGNNKANLVTSYDCYQCLREIVALTCIKVGGKIGYLHVPKLFAWLIVC